MKKKTKSKLRNDIALSFLLAIFVSLAGASINSVLFYRSFYQTLTKLNEDPIATITFKYKTAQRKFLERVVWDRLRQESPLYNGDTIHTSELSEATVTFTDGNKLVLQENSMIQIFADKDSQDGEYMASVLKGEAIIDSEESSNSFSCNFNEVKITTTAGSSVFAGSKVQVLNGKVGVTDGFGREQSISQGEALSINNSKLEESAFTVLYPSPNEKILFHDGNSRNVKFEWRAKNLKSDEGLRIEIAKDKYFKHMLDEHALNAEDSLELTLTAGTYYWRFVNVSSERQGRNSDSQSMVEAEGKIQMIYSPNPSLIAPVNDYSYLYRNKTPAVRLIWSEADQASSYRIVVANNPDLRNPVIDQRNSTNSASYTTLGEGTYYWQVTPFYSINRIGLEAPSQVGSFKILRQGVLKSPELFIPALDSVVDREKSAKPVTFSWKADSEAASYRITISERENLSNPVIKQDVLTNSFNVKGFSTFRDKKYYWTVQTIDGEGNISDISTVKSFFALEGKIDQRTIEPGDGYRVAHTLMQDMVFTWKRNLPKEYNTTLEIASDENFSKIVYSTDGNGYSLKDVVLPIGTYWWRLNSVAEGLDQKFYTKPKSFEVMDMLDPSVLYAPLGRAVAREYKPYEVKWKEVDGADFYKVSIYDSNEELIYEDNVTESHVFIDMYNGENFIDKANYRIEIQARANSIPGVMSRRSGKLIESKFQLFKLRPVEVVFPKRNAVLDGLDAFLNGVDIQWNSVDSLNDAQIVITRIDQKNPLVMLKIPSDEEFNAGNRVAPKRVNADPDIDFEAGTYEVVVYAHTREDDIDISNTDEEKRGIFTLTPYKKMDAAKNLSATPAVINAAFLKNHTPEIKFSWAAVPEASKYVFRIQGASFFKNKNVQIEKEVSSNSITINLTDDEYKAITAANGKYTWSVEAKRQISNSRKKKSLGGEIASSEFTIDVPLVNSQGIKSSGSSTKFGRRK